MSHELIMEHQACIITNNWLTIFDEQNKEDFSL